MDLTLTPAQLELQARARAFVRDVLQPREVEFERPAGACRASGATRSAARPSRPGSHGGSFPVELGGQGWSAIEQVLVHEQLGQSTGGLWSYIPGAVQRAHPLRRRAARAATSTRRMRGERSGSYAITEDGAGSDARALAATAVRDAATGDYVLNGEKWFVTGPDDTDFMIFHCLVVDGDAPAADAVPRRLRHARRHA